MAELLIRIVNSTLKGDPVFDSKASRRGDVICVMPDGWADQLLANESLPGAVPSGELRHPFWRIVRLPNVPVAVAEMLLGQEVDTDPLRPKQTLQFRLNSLDLDHDILVALRGWLADDTRAVRFRTSNISSATFMSLVKRKPPIPDPTAI